MLARPLRDAILATLALAPFASAQQPAGGGQGAPRHRSAAALGDSNVVIEHGQPTWNESRIGQIAQVPIGQVWRMGSEGMTTLSVSGAPIFFGEEFLRPGRYGFNLLHVADNAWSFVVFDPIHESQGTPQMMGDETNWQIPSKFVGDAAESVPELTIDVIADGESAVCELKWGPMRVTAPISAVQLATSEFELNGTIATATWYRRPLRPDADCTQPTIAGSIELEIEGEDCSMNIYLLQEGDHVVALFRNRERERWERENAGIEERVKQFEAAIQQFGAQAEAQIGPILQQMRRRKTKNEVLLEDSVGRPDNLRFTAPSEEAGGTARISCEFVKTRSTRNLEVVHGGRRALIRLDEDRFAVKASG